MYSCIILLVILGDILTDNSGMVSDLEVGISKSYWGIMKRSTKLIICTIVNFSWNLFFFFFLEMECANLQRAL